MSLSSNKFFNSFPNQCPITDFEAFVRLTQIIATHWKLNYESCLFVFSNKLFGLFIGLLVTAESEKIVEFSINDAA